ncbi:MAG: hypothetical protein HKN23_12420, partial [Verrucomicrobiales bacterium]|nr:hypothetical protein [Verrucomicrobiales bacterium]
MSKPLLHRRFRNLLSIFLLFCFGTWLAIRGWQLNAGRGIGAGTDFQSDWIEPVFLADPDSGETLQFRIPRTAKRIRITGYASVLPEGEQTESEEYPFRIEYRLLDSSGEAVEASTAKFLTTVPLYVNPEAPEDLIPVSAFVDSGLIPTSPKYIYLDLPADPSTYRLEVKTASSHHGVGSIPVRVAIREHIVDRKVVYLWDRLPEQDRTLMVRHRMKGDAELLMEEKALLMRRHWRSIAPIGIENREFIVREIESRLDFAGLIPYSDLKERRFDVNAGFKGGIQIPDSGKVVLQLDSAGPGIVELLLYNEAGDATSESIELTGEKPVTWRTEFGPGLIVLDPSVAIDFEAKLNGQPLETGPMQSRYWICNRNEPVRYRVDDADKARLTIRPLAKGTTDLQITITDPEGQELHREDLSAEF